MKRRELLMLMGGAAVWPVRAHSQKQAARVGERHRPRTAGPLDELRADDLLEPGDLLADGRLRV